ncbi:Cytochrome bo(3) ubiquinol oxidase subunit 1|uniref:cytochrome o ubiquinol oxidase subunit I n=1 Tax=Neochlamydia sp. AcF84 TaxID=2315858 RepID=UPI00140DB0D6|nr:cytochrome o ubiquinol oxidase subunit I [Neochlamydia sp. AcF84]NGY94188.1 Cytochrome bo(3) ubiquinol oxidase subunit 1 [Neochlamydia sp. AcF84]
MFGKLNLEAFKHDPIESGAGIGMAIAGLMIVALLFYFRRWKWLWNEWLTSLDHKKIGMMYIIVSLLMLFKGVVDALMLRAQQILAVGESQGFLTPSHFQQVFSAHGTTMIFFVSMGAVFGLLNLIVPLQIGARDVAFPFMNSLSFWLFAAGAFLVNLSLVIGNFSATGWLAYPPLSSLQYSPDVGVDYWIWSIQIAGMGSLLSGINFLVTILKMRCPGMTLMKMPLFTWSALNSMVLVIFAFPILTATLGMLSLDRTVGTHFFTADFGGNPMMYINLIWAWGHPEVYILMLPGFGIFSEVVATFSHKRLFGYTSMVWALASITFLSFIVWLHHFFTMGAGANVNAFFGIMTMLVAIPTGVKIFNWLFTMCRGRIQFSRPMLWFLGFVVIFTSGGMTGVLMSVPAADFQVHNSLFLVAHFHSMVIGGVLFAFFAGLAYWLPKFLGFKLHEKLGRYAFWCWIIGFFLAFMPLYLIGLMGATRRLNHYEEATGWHPLFVIAGVGVCIIIGGAFLQFLQLMVGVIQRKQNRVGNDPWNGRTLEWSTSSPPPLYNFAMIPEVNERDPYWAKKQAHVLDAKKPCYQDIHLPKNSAMGIYVASFSLLFGFAVIWHIWWLALLSLLGTIIGTLIRLLDDNTDYYLSAAEVEKIELAHARSRG